MRQDKITTAAVPPALRGVEFRAKSGPSEVRRKGRGVQSVAVPSGGGADDLLRLAALRDAARKPLPAKRGYSADVVQVARHLVSIASVVRDGAESVGVDSCAAGWELAQRAESLGRAELYVESAIEYARASAAGFSGVAPSSINDDLHRVEHLSSAIARGYEVRRRWPRLLDAVASLLDNAQEGESLSGETPPIELTDQTAEVPMLVYDLDRRFSCDESSVRGVVVGSRGSSVNVGALVTSVMSQSARRLFRRRVTAQPGGVVLIDASGSMDITSDRLAATSARIPAATIAYYSGSLPGRVLAATGREAWGALCIWARDGLRADSVPYRFGGNSVDWYAIQWLLAQPGPHVLISDQEFHGGPYGQDWKAAELLFDNPGVRVIVKFDELEAILDTGDPLFT